MIAAGAGSVGNSGTNAYGGSSPAGATRDECCIKFWW
jgi:hypothetical protein